MLGKNKIFVSIIAASLLASFNISYASERQVIQEGKTLNIHDMSLENLNYDGNGGAIENNGTLDINNTTLNNNSAVNGGAVYNTGELSITGNSSFVGNNVSSSEITKVVASEGWTYSAGSFVKDDGAISATTTQWNNGVQEYLYEGEVVGRIYYNGNGGAVYNTGKLTIDNAVFKDNSALTITENVTSSDTGTTTYKQSDGKGGAIYNTGDNGAELSITNSTFENNKSAEGGAIYNEGTINVIKGSTFTGNKAFDEYKSTSSSSYEDINGTTVTQTSEHTSSGGWGGAIYSQNSDLTIEDSTFENNTAAYGGALYVETGYPNGTLTIKNSKFINNSSYNDNPTKTTTITGNETQIREDGPYGLGVGGAIQAYANTTIEDSEFTGNTTGGDGGAISISGDLTVKNSTFKDNKAYAANKTTQYNYIGDELVSKTTHENTDGYGGAIAQWGDNLHIENSIFENNISGEESGGAIYTGSNNINIKDSTFTSNSTMGNGGAIYSRSDNMTVTNSTFADNKAEADILETSSNSYERHAHGGAIYNEGNLTIKDSTFTNNSATGKYTQIVDGTTVESYIGDGGAIDHTGELLSIENTTFNGNYAANNGGAIYSDYNTTISNSNPILNINNTIFENNIANSAGGAISTKGVETNISNSLFTNNQSSKTGGAINLQSAYIYTNPENQEISSVGLTLAPNTIADTTFNGNSSAKKGGAIYANKTPVRIVDTNFTNNSAKEGGAIYAGWTDEFADLGLLVEDLNENLGLDAESGVRITALNKDVKFSGNTAEKGGDIYLENNKLYLNANSGRTMYFGGGILGKNSIIDINNSTVNNLYENLSSVGKIVIDNFVSPDDNSALAVNLKAGTLALTKDNYLDGTDLTLEEGSLLDLGNNNVGEMNLNSLTSNNANLKIDMNLASSDQVFDTIKAATASGILSLKDVNIMSDFADITENIYTATIASDGIELKTPENGINAVTNDYVYTIKAKDNNLTVNRFTDENGEALKVDGFTVAVNQIDKVNGVDITLSDDRVFSAQHDIVITGDNSSKGWTGNLGGTSLTVNGKGYTLDGGDNTGLSVSDGQTLTFNDTNIEGFTPTNQRKGALTVNNGGTLNIEAINNNVTLGATNNANLNNVIYLDGTSSKSLFTTPNEKEITVNSNIRSASQSNELRLSGNGTITFNGIVDQLTLTNENTNTVHNTYIDGVNYNLNNGTVSFSKDEYLNGQGNKNTLNFNGGTLNIANNSVGTIDLAAININSNSNIMLDADLAKETMDKITADSATAAKDTILNVSEINLLSDAIKDEVVINAVEPAIMLGENDTLASHIATSVTEVAYSPIFKYGVGYNPSTGDFTFSRGSSQNYNNVNPAVMVGPVAAQLGGYVSMLDTYNNAFNNMDMRMLNPASVRLSQKQANRYAITETGGITYNTNETNSGGTWVRPFAAYDSVGLKNGPSVGSFSYGTFIGGDSAIHQFKNGGEGVLSAHVSYLGSHQSFDGNSIYQNGGNLGLTGTYYKGNFFTGLTVNAGASVADASTRYGNEDFPMFMAGVANKTGYNFEFKDGKFIIQPSLLLSYTFVNTFNYTNAAGVSINGDPLHALQISPNVRFALNTKNGWQPYLTAGMNWNIMNDSQFTANMATLPDLSMKPYVQYGLGIQKTINDNFTAYGQVLLRHGGRNGIAANAGLRYLFGKESKQPL